MTNTFYDINKDLTSMHPAAVLIAARNERAIELGRIFALTVKAISKATGKVLSMFSVASIKEAYRYKRTVRELEALSDSMLRDIGLNRGMISYAARTGIIIGADKADVADSMNKVVVKTTTAATATVAANTNEAKKHNQAA